MSATGVVPPGEREPNPGPGDTASCRRYSDVGNAARLRDAIVGQLRWVAPWGAWLRYEHGCWRRDTTGIAQEAAKNLGNIILDEAASIADKDTRKDAIRWALRSESAATVTAALKLAGSDPLIATDPGQFDAHPWLLGARNGVLDLRTGRLQSHSPDLLLTKQTNAIFDHRAEAPRWLAFVESVLPDQSLRSFVQRSLGCALVGEVREHALWLAVGTGANGKSTLLGAVQHVLGDYAITAAPELLLAGQPRHETGLADLRGARFVVTSESDDGRRLAEATVKALTGGDRVKARYMRQDFFEFDPTWSMWVATNHRPEVRGTDDGIWRRLKVVPFTVSIAKDDQDPDLPAALRREAAGILRWLLDGCTAWQQEGLSEPLAVRMATEDYRSSQDALADFFGDCCIIDQMHTASAKDLLTAYNAWLEEQGERHTNQKRLGLALAERGLEKYRSNQGFRYRGIGLVNDVNLVNQNPA